MSQKPMSAADYRRHAEAKRSEGVTEIVTLSSGSVFELRRLDLQGHVLLGSVPQSLLAEGLSAWQGKGIAPPSQTRTDASLTAEALIFMREVVHECTVSPKFVEFATNDNEISARDMLKEDFLEIYHWAMGTQGVAGLDGLKSFREGRARSTANARAHSKKQRRKAEQPVEPVGTVQ
jgi:hypothetical protein